MAASDSGGAETMGVAIGLVFELLERDVGVARTARRVSTCRPDDGAFVRHTHRHGRELFRDVHGLVVGPSSGRRRVSRHGCGPTGGGPSAGAL